MIETLSQTDYEHERHFGSAGLVTHLDAKTIDAWRADEPRWAGKYWLFVRGDDKLWSLRPIYVITREKKK
ncbi:hypothetical protein JK358_38040 [Nocardia sp. 2]|uniref:Uncharacterized protein n=1 Tax=Nocardia acididurans TaxID=2802282 RepID=A0ABS1MI30_9NOCA|nr:hypothetical protein [Nocardia acididurans]MBL1080212.1 hypothetical protein [Nocardia acididurans]